MGYDSVFLRAGSCAGGREPVGAGMAQTGREAGMGQAVREPVRAGMVQAGHESEGARIAKADTVEIQRLLEASQVFIDKEGEYKADIDSGLYYADKALIYSKDPSIGREWWLRSMKQKGLCYLEGRNVPAGKQCFQQVIDYLSGRKNFREAAAVWTTLGKNIDDHQNEMSREKENCFRHARALYLSLGDSLGAANSLKDVADVHLNEGRLGIAENELLDVLGCLKRNGDNKLHNTYYLLSQVNRLKGDQKKELFYCLETVKSMKETGDSALAGLFYGKLAQTYDELGMYDQSIFYRRSAMAADRRIEQYDWVFYDMQAFSHSMVLAGRAAEALAEINRALHTDPASSLYQRNLSEKALGNCYAALRRNANAEACYLRMIATSDSLFKGKTWNAEDLLRDYLTISDFYLSEHKFSRASSYIDKMMELPQKIVSPMNVSRIHFQQFKVDSAMGRFAAAIDHFEIYKRINDSLFDAKKQKQINELQIQYETSQKDKDLQLQAKNIQLLTKQTQLQKSETERAGIFRDVLLAGLGLVLLLLVALYSRYRFKIRTNRQLEEQQREISGKNEVLQRLLQDNEWLLKEVHHRVKNNLQVVVSLLSSQSAYLQDQNALNAVLDSQHRIQAMSLIHQKLYKSANASSVFMPDYINELVEYLKESFTTRQRIFFRQELGEVSLDAAFAVPLGLILNESITNSIKYAFLAGGAKTGNRKEAGGAKAREGEADGVRGLGAGDAKVGDAKARGLGEAAEAARGMGAGGADLAADTARGLDACGADLAGAGTDGEDLDSDEEIVIRLLKDENGIVRLVIADNGRGLPDGFDIETTQTFGLVLIRGLVEDLRGGLSITGLPGKGVRIDIVFKV